MENNDKIKIVNWKQYVIANQAMFFGSDGATPMAIASDIARGALVLGCNDCQIVHADGWWLISSSSDWLLFDNKEGADENSVFTRMYAFPEEGQNSQRSECMAYLFSSALVTSNKAGVQLLKGSEVDLEQFCSLTSDNKAVGRVIGFRFLQQA